jgi:hypothetical protein
MTTQNNKFFCLGDPEWPVTANGFLQSFYFLCGTKTTTCRHERSDGLLFLHTSQFAKCELFLRNDIVRKSQT